MRNIKIPRPCRNVEPVFIMLNTATAELNTVGKKKKKTN
jgi:hypothetical protein